MLDRNRREPNFIEKRRAEPNFIDKRREWKSKMDKPLSRRMLIMVLPALILSVFVMMSAPYLKLIVEEFMHEDDMSYPVKLNLDDAKIVEKEGPPPSADAVLLQDYRDQLAADGFDWTKEPELEKVPNLDFAKEQELPVNPIDAELPNTMTELRALSKTTEAQSE